MNLIRSKLGKELSVSASPSRGIGKECTSTQLIGYGFSILAGACIVNATLSYTNGHIRGMLLASCVVMSKWIQSPLRNALIDDLAAAFGGALAARWLQQLHSTQDSPLR